jgi:hypothetical protein
MTRTKTYESPISRPLFGAIAVAATFATLGLAVVGPAALSQSSAAQSEVAARAAGRPVEVAIVPGTIQVVAKRAKVARAGNGFVPASYNVR